MNKKSRASLIGTIAAILATTLPATGCQLPVSSVPGPKGTIAINGGEAFTFSASESIDIAMINADSMRFSDDGMTWTDWEPYSAAKTWSLPSKPGLNTVHAEFRNSSGSVVSRQASVAGFCQDILTAADGVANDCLSGYSTTGTHGSPVSLSADGSLALFGTFRRESTVGAVYINGWNGVSWNASTQTASDAPVSVRFGFSTASSSDGTVIAVGALDNKAYIYRWTGASWIETMIKASDAAAGQGYGVAVSLSADGTVLAVGAYTKTGPAPLYETTQGMLYVYEWDGADWLETRLSPSSGGANLRDGFHVSVSGDGDTIASGALFDLANRGSVLVYRRTPGGWAETRVSASDGMAQDFFGRFVSLSDDGNTLAVSAYKTDVSALTDSGAAYVYRWNGDTWAETKLSAAEGQASAFFGYFASLSGDGTRLLVGAPGTDVDGRVDQGRAFLYSLEAGTWNLAGTLTASDGAAGDFYGYSGAISRDGSTLAVGAPAKDLGANVDQGAVYLY